VVMVEMAVPVSRMKSIWRPSPSILTMDSWGPIKREPGWPQSNSFPQALGCRLPWIWWQPLLLFSFPFSPC
jgi:hypothetical protein